MKINIYLDDLRPLPTKEVPFLLAKTAEECLDIMRKNKGNVNYLSLDHDLSDTSEDEKHGYWFVKNMVKEGLYADKIYLHTGNPIGRMNMYHYLLNAIKHEMIPDHIKVYNCPIPFEYEP